MDDNDRKEVFDRLVEILRRHGLGWVVDQVNEEIHNGKTEYVEVETIKRTEDTGLLLPMEQGRPTGPVRRGPRARFSTTVDYNEKEKLELLMDGIVQVTTALEIEVSALEQLRAIVPGIGLEARLFSEASNTTATVMSPAKLANRDQVVKNCLDAISKMREESEKD